MKEEEGGGGRAGAKGVALQTSPATYRYPGIMGLFPGPPKKGRLELGPTRNQVRPDWNQNLNQKPDQNQNSSSLPRGGDQCPILSSGQGPFNQIPTSRTQESKGKRKDHFPINLKQKFYMTESVELPGSKVCNPICFNI